MQLLQLIQLVKSTHALYLHHLPENHEAALILILLSLCGRCAVIGGLKWQELDWVHLRVCKQSQNVTLIVNQEAYTFLLHLCPAPFKYTLHF